MNATTNTEDSDGCTTQSVALNIAMVGSCAIDGDKGLQERHSDAERSAGFLARHMHTLYGGARPS